MMHFLFNKADNSHCYHTEDENDKNLSLIADETKNYYVHLPDFNPNTHPELVGPEDVWCVFYDPDINDVYLPTTLINMGYPHGQKYLENWLKEYMTSMTLVDSAAALTEDTKIMMALAMQYLPSELYESITADNAIDAAEAQSVLDALLNEIENGSNTENPA